MLGMQTSSFDAVEEFIPVSAQGSGHPGYQAVAMPAWDSIRVSQAGVDPEL